MARLFFAVWPDALAAARLAALAGDLAAACGGKPVPESKIHLTLAFLGETAPERAAAAIEAARGVRFAPFGLALDCVGSFRAARVAWAGSLAPQAGLAALHADLAARLRAAQFALEERPFAAHATLARRAMRAVPRARVEPVAWTV
ncbi:MAG TPA: RNA 2',3'-cyclic phosphodiesterase, partial [Usitatibacter sp.]|nr:RNA 2',3'-cyclic phosphodiesterase [Usitatibacter sp.]